MRAVDRLVATLLILQARGRITAGELAVELEVSERTARRDLEALAVAGVPVYSQVGRGRLVADRGARTDLTGLTAAEARTLFLVAGPSSSATPEVRAALRKLVRALPETFRVGAEAAASAVVFDPAGWDRTRVPPPADLDVLQHAVVDGVQVRLGYQGRDRPPTERVVHPLGLVAKGTAWYLVAGTDAGLRTFRVNRVRSVVVTGEPAHRPEGFDLAATWDSIMASIDERRATLRTVVRATSESVGWLRGQFGTRMAMVDGATGDRVEVEIRGHSAESVAAELASFGNRIEVVSPPEVRAELARIGAELVASYAPSDARS